MTRSPADAQEFARTVRQILRVNYAGEYGAVRIYGAQIAMAQLFHRRAVSFLQETVQHERRHAQAFRKLMPARDTRPCGATPLWGLGGSLLGAITGLFGANAMMVCTEAVERTVHAHLNRQLAYLGDRDGELSSVIAGIRDEEVGHHDEAMAQQTSSGPALQALDWMVAKTTTFLIWCSTYGALTRMKRGIADTQQP
jgi:ubiquinone biosynthesis monooxygenase Coq7